MATDTIPYYLQAPEKDAPTAEPRSTAFADLSTKIAREYEDLVGAREKQAGMLEQKAAAMDPKLTAAQTALETRAREGERRAAAVEAARPEIAAPPSRKLTEFLSPREGESPEASVMKLIQGLGLLAGSIGGMAKGDARGALAGLKGALAGWSEGDAARADRAFADWKAKTDAALMKWRIERESYQVWLENGNLSYDAMMKGLELTAISHDNPIAAQAFRAGSHEAAVKWLTDAQKHEDTVADHRLRLEQMHDEKERDRQLRREIAQITAAAKQTNVDEVLAQYTPDVLKSLGQQWALTGKVPGGLGYGRAGQAVRAKVVQAGLEWAKENGLDPMTLPTVQAEVVAAKSALTRTQGQRAFTLANAGNFERHLETLLRLSEKVDRTNRPVVNQYLLAGRRDYQGDVAAATYLMQAFEVSMEYAKLMVGTAQGDEASRREAREAIATRLTHGQLKDIRDTLVLNAKNRIASWDAEIRDLTNIINRAARVPEKEPIKEPGSTVGGTMRIRRMSDGKVFEGPAGPIPAGYEAVK